MEIFEKIKGIEKQELKAGVMATFAFLIFSFLIFFAVRNSDEEIVVSLEGICKEEGGYWHEMNCYDDIRLVLGMFEENKCEEEGFYWYNDSCNELEEELSLEELFVMVEKKIIEFAKEIGEKRKEDDSYNSIFEEFQKIEEQFLKIGQIYINKDYQEEEMLVSLKDISGEIDILFKKTISATTQEDDYAEAKEEMTKEKTTPTPAPPKTISPTPSPTPPPTPPEKELTDFEKRANCVARGLYWYNDTCNQQPQQTTGTVEDVYVEPTPTPDPAEDYYEDWND